MIDGEARSVVDRATSAQRLVESFQAGFGPHAKTIRADIANYTDLAPVMQFSEVVVGQ